MEDLREYYITPLYLKTMESRARKWSDDLIKEQIQLFQDTIPDYPEVHEMLESELHRRNLNRLRHKTKSMTEDEIRNLKARSKPDSDSRELLEVELEIRQGARRVSEPGEKLEQEKKTEHDPKQES